MSQGKRKASSRRLSHWRRGRAPAICWRSGCFRWSLGAGTGVVSGAFRLVLANADRLRDAFVLWARGQAAVGFCVAVFACAAATVLAAWLVRRFAPYASGSGIPHVESVLREELPPDLARTNSDQVFWRRAGYRLGTCARPRGAERADGREHRQKICLASGFTWAGKTLEFPPAAGAGAGLAAAFNAPVAGAILCWRN